MAAKENTINQPQKDSARRLLDSFYSAADGLDEENCVKLLSEQNWAVDVSGLATYRVSQTFTPIGLHHFLAEDNFVRSLHLPDDADLRGNPLEVNIATEVSTATPICNTQDDVNNAEVRELLTDIRMVGDLLIAANNSPDELLEDTPGHAGWFIERTAGKLQRLLVGGAT